MRLGSRVRYHTWWWDKWITLEGKYIVDDSGVTTEPEAMMTRNDGWELFVPELHSINHKGDTQCEN